MNHKERFNYLFRGYFFGFLPFALLFGILALVHLVPVTINDKSYYGVLGFFALIFAIPFVALFFTVLNWLYLSFGLWIYSLCLTLRNKKKAQN
ncbi:MAG TPA: hypothetical protein VFF27_13260 [Bacteroidia bacterium]|nr:hypothetical protein [Bacteroidia bacterium]